MRKMCKLKSSALLILILALYFFAYLCGNVIIVRADNKIDMQNAFEERNVMDDLKGSMIDGKAFNLKDYGLNSRGALRVFSFVEFGYSYDFTRQNDYGLYVYVSILGIIVLIIVLIPVLPIIIQGIVWVIALPFKLISSLFKAIFKKKE